MPQPAEPDFWQTFFNLGGIAGALSLIWQIAKAIWEFFRKSRLKVLALKGRDILTISIQPPAEPDERRYVTLRVKNIGRHFAHRCVAYAKLMGNGREVSLHWADTEIRYETGGRSSQVDIPPGFAHRLDVAFSSSRGKGAWLASEAALHRYDDYAKLDAGQCLVKVRVTCEDGNIAVSWVRLRSSDLWHDFNGERMPRSLLLRASARLVERLVSVSRNA